MCCICCLEQRHKFCCTALASPPGVWKVSEQNCTCVKYRVVFELDWNQQCAETRKMDLLKWLLHVLHVIRSQNLLAIIEYVELDKLGCEKCRGITRHVRYFSFSLLQYVMGSEWLVTRKWIWEKLDAYGSSAYGRRCFCSMLANVRNLNEMKT